MNLFKRLSKRQSITVDSSMIINKQYDPKENNFSDLPWLSRIVAHHTGKPFYHEDKVSSKKAEFHFYKGILYAINIIRKVKYDSGEIECYSVTGNYTLDFDNFPWMYTENSSEAATFVNNVLDHYVSALDRHEKSMRAKSNKDLIECFGMKHNGNRIIMLKRP